MAVICFTCRALGTKCRKCQIESEEMARASIPPPTRSQMTSREIMIQISRKGI